MIFSLLPSSRLHLGLFFVLAVGIVLFSMLRIPSATGTKLSHMKCEKVILFNHLIPKIQDHGVVSLVHMSLASRRTRQSEFV
jgi:hypothetical protein